MAHIANSLQVGNKTITAIGIAIPGLVNRQIDKVVVSRDLPDTVRDDLHSELSRATGLRVEIENDANAGAYGEYQVGAGRGSRNMFYITIGQGIGGAIISMANCGPVLPVLPVRSDTSPLIQKASSARAAIPDVSNCCVCSKHHTKGEGATLSRQYLVTFEVGVQSGLLSC